MQQKTFAVQGHGQADIGNLSAAEQRVLYDALISRLIALLKARQEGVI